jgi:SAM-dependent methyltransferase
MITTDRDVQSDLLRSNYSKDYYVHGHGGFQEDALYRRALSAYWKKAIFLDNGLDAGAPVLDFGAGMGTVTGALENVTSVEWSDYARGALMSLGRQTAADLSELEGRKFKYILSCHSLEHCLKPHDILMSLRNLIAADGRLVIILPREWRLQPSPRPDANRHLYCWTFQTLTNLLMTAGWSVERQMMLKNPFALNTLIKIFGCSADTAANAACRLAKLFQRQQSMMTIATPTAAICIER